MASNEYRTEHSTMPWVVDRHHHYVFVAGIKVLTEFFRVISIPRVSADTNSPKHVVIVAYRHDNRAFKMLIDTRH